MAALKNAGTRIGYALGSAARVIDPEAVVLGGLLTRAGGLLSRCLEDGVNAAISEQGVNVLVVAPGDIVRSEVSGAVALALRGAHSLTAAEVLA